jgi:hypothetical protein
MSAKAIAAFMQSPYGIVADVKMLNFFRFIGHGLDGGGRAGGGGTDAEFLVPVFVSLRSAAGNFVIVQPVAHSSECGVVH